MKAIVSIVFALLVCCCCVACFGTFALRPIATTPNFTTTEWIVDTTAGSTAKIYRKASNTGSVTFITAYGESFSTIAPVRFEQKTGYSFYEIPFTNFSFFGIYVNKLPQRLAIENRNFFPTPSDAYMCSDFDFKAPLP